MFQAVSLIVIAVLTAVDLILKYIVTITIKANGPVKFLFGAFQLRYTENTGAAFSSFSDDTVLLTVITAVILAGCLIMLLSKKVKPLFMNICLMLVVAGGTGNLIDRIRFGYVIDFIEPLFIDFAVFNFADCCITVGAFMMIAYEIYELVSERKKKAVKNG